MTTFDYGRPFIGDGDLGSFVALDRKIARRYGEIVKATELSNIEYKFRYQKLWGDREMKPPPSTGRIFMGYLVVRNLGLPDQYETWIPDDVFAELYEKVQ